MPTLAADEALSECLRALARQTLNDFEVVVIDNSGAGRVQTGGERVRVIRNASNAGFGAAVNQAFRSSQAKYLVTLNDDAIADERWLERLVACADQHPEAGMFASEVRLANGGLDSAGMVIAADGSSKQRGHGAAPEEFAQCTDALFPSGSAALYRRTMLDEIGMFDEDFFLYCEDTDLGLRARWAGWECRYVPGAIVEHKYSHSAGRASLLKAYYVERNRLYAVIKNFPARLLWRAPFAAIARYFWHLLYMLGGRGKAAEFHTASESGFLLPFVILRAHAVALLRVPSLWKKRRAIERKTTTKDFLTLLAKHSASVREVAAH